MNLNQSKRTALKFVQAEKCMATLHASASEETKARCQTTMREATTALQNDLIAQQLLPSAREFERQTLERRTAIKKNTMLGALSDKLEFLDDYGEKLNPGDFKETLIDDDYDNLCKVLGKMDADMAQEVVFAFSQLLGSLVIDLTSIELPPVPKFTI